MNFWRPWRQRPERGAAAVEFALVVPLLLILAFGILSFGYMLSFRQAISQGAAEGARAAAVASFGTQGKQVEVSVAAINDSLASYGVTCAIPTPYPVNGAPATVTATANLRRNNVDVGTCTVKLATCVNNTAVGCASITLDYAYRDHALLPTLPGIGLVLPDQLAYTAVAQVS